MPKILTILTIDKDEKTLRKISEDVPMDTIKSEEFHTFLDDLHYTVSNTKMKSGWIAAGLAAIQVGKPLNVFLAEDFNEEIMMEYINPKVEPLGQACDTQLEGCLSFPDTTAYVERHKRVRITYLDRYGNKHRKKMSGFNARLVLHENDHLKGILFTDKVVDDASNS